MQRVITSDEFVSFKTDLNKVIKIFNETQDEIKQDVKTKYNLEKYNEIIEGSDEDVLTQYETWYDQLAEVVIYKNNAMKHNYEVLTQLKQMVELINKEIENNDEIKVTLNQVVYKIIDKEIIIFNKKEEEIKKKLIEEEETRKHKFAEKLKELNGLKYQYDVYNPIIEELFPNETKEIQQPDEIVELIPSFYKLKEWSGKQKCSIIFDSNIDGDGGNNVLYNKVKNKTNLYFISFDNENNVFGGYVDTDYSFLSPKSFTFSLIRNGKLRNMKYNIRNDVYINEFKLNSNSDDWLYLFGKSGNYLSNSDIFVYRIGNTASSCFNRSYEYNDDYHPFVDNYKFTTRRILVIEMI